MNSKKWWKSLSDIEKSLKCLVYFRIDIDSISQDQINEVFNKESLVELKHGYYCKDLTLEQYQELFLIEKYPSNSKNDHIYCATSCMKYGILAYELELSKSLLLTELDMSIINTQNLKLLEFEDFKRLVTKEFTKEKYGRY